MLSGDTEAQRAADSERQLKQLKAKRSEVRRRMTLICNEISRIIRRVGTRTSLNCLVTQAEELLVKSRRLNDQICSFKDMIDTNKEFQSQLEYQRLVQDAKDDVLNYALELF